MTVRWKGTPTTCYLRCDADPQHPCPCLVDGGDGTETSVRHTARLLGWDCLIGLDLCPAHLATVRTQQATVDDPGRLAWLRRKLAGLDEQRGSED